ncbi:hypothetical protein CTAYLR_002319 [Chrysophaeum taylorii]|uniref:TRAF-type domain-containing protein n=1 Tax=Chrysophaeum taylorii TaxID=2483200 RepID=A0AAD7UQB1_9STRA|nr:hypothetical protein CTAYLR_002319 [Chrysophaeum taylorii]
MARLFTLVTLGETDAVEAIVKPGEPFKQGNLGRFIDELAFEDAAHESAHKSIVELTNEVREYKLEESVEIDKLRKRRQEAERIEKLADRALAVRVEAQQAVDAKLSRGARALQTIEAPDINELRSLRHDSVSKRVLRVLEACCELLCTNAADADVSKESDDDSRATASSAATFHKTARALTSASSMRKLDAEDHAQRWKVVRKVLLKDANLIQKLCFFTTRDVADPEALAHKIRTTYADDAHHLVDSVNDDEGEYNNLLLLLSERERDADAADAAADEVINKVAATAHSARCLRPAFNPEESNSPSNHEMVTFVIDGYELAGALAVWVNGHLAALESARVVVNLEHIETTLRSRFDMQRVPALESADQAAFRARNKQNIGNRELEQAREEEAYRRHRIKVCEGKVRVARVLQKYTQRGHSLLTWACALGNAHVAEVLIDHGSCPGLPDDVGSSAIRIIQLLYRHHRWRQAVREQRAQNQHPPSASEVASQRMREATFGFVLARQIALYSDLRVRARVPLCEAAYNGHERIFEIFKRRRILPTTHRSMLVTACRPQPPFPFAAKPDDQRDPQKKGRHLRVVSLPECVQLGRKELAHQHWQYGHAWIGADDRSGPRERTRMQASAAWSAYSRAQKYGARQQDSRVKHRAQKEKRDAAICDLVAAMFGGNFNRVSQLFDEGNVPVDYEDSSGMTPLIAAAGEDSAMESRIQSYDVEHKPVLAVVLLLDRRKRRPKVDAENRRGETAFCVACQKGRLDVAAALLERGANINFQSQAARQGWTPLRWTVEVNGRPATIDLLVERGAVVDERAEDGLTPVEAAIAHHHTDAAGALAKHRSGDVGLVVAELGVANKAFSCAFGCGAFFVRENDAAAHRETCSKKPVRCSECGDTELWAEELASHLKDTCPVARIVVCPLGCGESFRAENAANHAVICKYRVVTCSMCGVDVRETRIQVHQTYFCPSRPIPRNVKPERRRRRRNVRCPKRDSLVPKTKLEPPDAHARPTLAAVECPNRCGTRPRTCDLPTHLAKTCTRRWVECERCGVKVRRRDLERHLSCDAPLSVRCQLSAEPCPNKCGRSMPLRQLEVHQRFECARRAVPCGLCGMDVEAARASTHKDVECPMRSVECPNRLCYLRLPLANIKKHALLECKKRIVRCLQGCGERTFVKNLAKHHAECCTFRFVDCRLGCGKRLRAKDEWDHVERHCIRRSTANYVWGSNGQDITARKTQQQQSRL